MTKQTLLKLLILLTAVSFNTVKSYGSVEVEQSIQTTVPHTVAIEETSESINHAAANSQSGVHSGLQSVFSLVTNGSDEDYDFIVTSKIQTASGPVSAYGENESILFAHTLVYPTEEAIEDAKIGGSNNANVIAYKVTASITEPMTIDFKNNYGVYGDCYVVKVNSGTEGILIHKVSPNPVSNTYNVGQDQAGTYRAVVYFTAISK